MNDLIERQAAIKAIEDLQDCYNGFSDSYDKACIIGVLEEVPSAEPDVPDTNVGDIISRQAAIDICRKYNGYGSIWSCILSDIQFLPAVQPDMSEYSDKLWKAAYERGKTEALADADVVEVVRCKDCKYWTHIKRTDRYWCKTDDGLYDLNPSPDDFCSRAERRTDE